MARVPTAWLLGPSTDTGEELGHWGQAPGTQGDGAGARWWSEGTGTEAERLELVPCPALVPCVQRQKMVSDSPGLLLVPHTSSRSSLVTSDMMGTWQKEGLCFSDSGPGT